MTRAYTDAGSVAHGTATAIHHPPFMNALVVTFDRLPLRMLGCYGNDWIETAAFDTLAAHGVVFDQHFGQCFSESESNSAAAWWTGRRDFSGGSHRPIDDPPVAELLREQGVRTLMVSERTTGRPAFEARAAGFDEVYETGGEYRRDVEPQQTPVMRLAARAAEILDGLRDDSQPWLLWVRSDGVPMPWIPPDEVGEIYADEFELSAEPPDDASQDGAVANDADALDRLASAVNTIAGWGAESDAPPSVSDAPPTVEDVRRSLAACAGCVTLLDVALGKILDACENACRDEDVLVIVTAARGLSLGERLLRLDATRSLPLAEEIVHTPLLVDVFTHADSNLHTGGRRQSLVQTTDVGPTLLDWFASDELTSERDGQSLFPLLRDETDAIHEHLCLVDDAGGASILTPEFRLIREPNQPQDGESAEHDARLQLFAKPDDVWDVHDVAAEYIDETERLAAILVRIAESGAMKGSGTIC